MIVPNGELHRALVQHADVLRRLKQMNNLPSHGQYSCFEDYVANHGVTYEREPLTRDERAYVREVIRRSGGLRMHPIKQCFGNAQLLLTRDYEHRLTYVEGFAFSIIPVLHGWLDLDGKVIDTTLRQDRNAGGRLANRVLGTWRDERQYHGVHFSREYVLQKILDRRFFGTLIDDYWKHWPLLSGEVVAHLTVAPRGNQSSANNSLDTLADSGQV